VNNYNKIIRLFLLINLLVNYLVRVTCLFNYIIYPKKWELKYGIRILVANNLWLKSLKIWKNIKNVALKPWSVGGTTCDAGMN